MRRTPVSTSLSFSFLLPALLVVGRASEPPFYAGETRQYAQIGA